VSGEVSFVQSQFTPRFQQFNSLLICPQRAGVTVPRGEAEHRDAQAVWQAETPAVVFAQGLNMFKKLLMPPVNTLRTIMATTRITTTTTIIHIVSDIAFREGGISYY
jgi:hypothetical protein